MNTKALYFIIYIYTYTHTHTHTHTHIYTHIYIHNICVYREKSNWNLFKYLNLMNSKCPLLNTIILINVYQIHPAADTCILFTQDSKRDRKYPGASPDDLHARGGRRGRGRVFQRAGGWDYRCGFFRWESDLPRRDFLVISWPNKLLFASFAGCFSGLKQIILTATVG